MGYHWNVLFDALYAHGWQKGIRSGWMAFSGSNSTESMDGHLKNIIMAISDRQDCLQTNKTFSVPLQLQQGMSQGCPLYTLFFISSFKSSTQ